MSLIRYLQIGMRLLKKDLLIFLKDRPAVVLTYIMPVLVIFIFGSIFGAAGDGATTPSGIRLGVVDASGSPLVAELIKELEALENIKVLRHARLEESTRPLTEADVREAIGNNRLQFALVFPADAVPERGLGLKVNYLYNPKSPLEEQMMEGSIRRTLFLHTPRVYLEAIQESLGGLFTEAEVERFNRGIAQTVAETFEMDPEDAFAMIAEGNPMSALTGEAQGEDQDLTARIQEMAGGFLQINQEQLVGEAVRNPVGTRLIGGWAIMFLLFSLSGAASSLFDEKHAGIFYRLLSGPAQREHILFGKFGLMVLIGLSQLLLCFLAGWVFFRIEIFSFLVPLALYSLVVALCCTAFGMLLCAISKTSAQANGFATLLILPMSALGGAWWPVSLMPEWIQFFSGFTLVYWAIEGYEQILWAQSGLAGAAAQISILLGFTAAALAFSVWRFRSGDLFR